MAKLTTTFLLLCLAAAFIAETIPCDQNNLGPSCVGDVELGQECISEDQCADKYSICREDAPGGSRKCLCRSTHFQGVDETNKPMCLEKLDFGCKCESAKQCKPIDSVCIEETGQTICNCHDDYYQGHQEDTGQPMCRKKVELGSRCLEDGSPQCKDANAECYSSSCRCTQDYYQGQDVDNKTVCLKKIDYGQDCLPGAECSLHWAVCRPEELGGPDYKCLCSIYSYEEMDEYNKPECIRKIYPGDPCNSTHQCFSIDSECLEKNGNKTCECPEDRFLGYDYDYYTSACIKKKELGGFCMSQETKCVDPHAVCQFDRLKNKLDLKCLCKPDYYQGVDADSKPICLEKKALRQECLSAVECKPSNTVCEAITEGGSTVCQCDQDSYEGVDDEKMATCFYRKDVGLPCESDKECKDPNSKCLNNNSTFTCTCHGSYAPLDGKCIEKVNIGDECLINEQCQTANTSCVVSADKRTCECISGTVQPPFESFCVKDYLIGQRCGEDWQCSGNSFCNGEGSVCACLKDFIANANLNKCLRLATRIGDDCEESLQCIQGTPGTHSNCTDTGSLESKTCSCTADAIEDYSDVCLLKALQLGDSCFVSDQCSANLDESVCLLNVCTCNSGAVASNDLSKCLTTSVLGEVCVENSQCTKPYSECSEYGNERRCDCNSNAVRVGKDCLRLAEYLGDYCHDVEQCRNLENAVCASKCRCDNQQHVPSYTSTSCLPVVDELHIRCQETSQCLVADSSCLPDESDPQKNKCQCPSTFVEFSGGCLDIQTDLYGSCSEDVQCVAGINEHAICDTDKTCKCSKSAREYHGVCLIPSKLNEACTTDTQCYLGVNTTNAFCDEHPSGVCACREGFAETGDSCNLSSLATKIIQMEYLALFLVASSLWIWS